MIQQYLKKGIIKWAVSAGLLVMAFFIMGSTWSGNYKKFGEGIGIILTIVSTVICLLGCSEMLQAKGYDTSMMLAFLIPGICCSGVFILIAPFVIIFGLKDKTRNRSRRRRHSN
jgi:hypothetical protein